MEAAWPTLVYAEKVTIAKQLQRSISLLRTLEQPPGQEFIGTKFHKVFWTVLLLIRS